MRLSRTPNAAANNLAFGPQAHSCAPVMTNVQCLSPRFDRPQAYGITHGIEVAVRIPKETIFSRSADAFFGLGLDSEAVFSFKRAMPDCGS